VHVINPGPGLTNEIIRASVGNRKTKTDRGRRYRNVTCLSRARQLRYTTAMCRKINVSKLSNRKFPRSARTVRENFVPGTNMKTRPAVCLVHRPCSLRSYRFGVSRGRVSTVHTRKVRIYQVGPARLFYRYSVTAMLRASGTIIDLSL